MVGLSRLAQLDAYALIQMTNGLLQLVLARRPKVHRVRAARYASPVRTLQRAPRRTQLLRASRTARSGA